MLFVFFLKCKMCWSIDIFYLYIYIYFKILASKGHWWTSQVLQITQIIKKYILIVPSKNLIWRKICSWFFFHDVFIFMVCYLNSFINLKCVGCLLTFFIFYVFFFSRSHQKHVLFGLCRPSITQIIKSLYIIGYLQNCV